MAWTSNIMLDFEKLIINGKVIDFSLISSDRELVRGKQGKLLILQAMDFTTNQNQSNELMRLNDNIDGFAIMFPSPSTKGQYELIHVDLKTYEKVKDFSVRALTVN